MLDRPALGLLLVLGACGGTPPRSGAPTPAELRRLLEAGNGSNVAATADGAPDPRLLPFRYPGPPDQAMHALIAAIGSLPRWRLVDSTDGVLWASRTTRLFRFVDDVYLLVRAGPGDSSTIEARSASRVGQSDLGQNRRNLAQLWAALRNGLPNPH
jgi:uncharacterized protein (DUF1499 family)